MRPEELSRQLREGSDGFLARWRKMAGLALLAAGSIGLISLYQHGVIKYLPDPPLPGFDSDKVDAASEAYSRFQTPDGPIGLSSYHHQAEEAAAQLEDGRSVSITRCGRSPHVERPDRFVAALGRFLADHTDDGARGGE